MEFESKAKVILSPGARVVVGPPWLTLVSAAGIGLVAGLIGATVLAQAQRRAVRRRPPRGSLGPQLRLPGECSDVETEL